MTFQNSPFALRRASRIGALGIVVSVCLSEIAFAQVCEHTPALVSGVSVAPETDPAPYAMTPASNRWSAVGVRAGDAMDWNLEAFDAKTPYPICFAGGLASSAESSIDFLVTDWRFRAPQTDYVRAATPALTGSDARVEYEQAAYEYQSNRPFDQIFIQATDVLTVRETDMQAGARYNLEIWPSAGLSGLKCYLFAPASAGSGWIAKSERVLEVDLVDGGGNGFHYIPSVTGQYAIVVTNEDATAGNFYIAVKHCPFSASSLTDNVPIVNVMLDAWPGLTPTTHTWGVVGERGEPGYFYNLDVAPGFRLSSYLHMTCSDSILKSQSSGVLTKVIAGDFRANPLRFYTAHVGLGGQPKTNSEGYVEWEDGLDSLVVNAPATAVNPPAHNVLDAWSVRLVTGGTYTFQVVPDDGTTATYRMLVFGNPSPGTEYWGSREDAVIESLGPVDFSPDATGLYGLVVVNDNGGTGGYSITVTSTLVGVDAGTPARGISQIRSIRPNPGFGRAEIDFELARAGQASLRVTDVLGRTVAEVPASLRSAGANRLTWNGRTSRGAKPAAGVYFVVLDFDGVPQDRAKLIVLP